MFCGNLRALRKNLLRGRALGYKQEMDQNNRDVLITENSFDWAKIAALVAGDFSNARQCLESQGLNAHVLSQLSRRAEIHEAYGRKILFSSPQYEMMLASWGAGAVCAPHDHANSFGAVWLVEGGFLEQHFALRPLEGRLSLVSPAIFYRENSVILVSPGDIHSMQALSSGMSLHIYSPPVCGMRIFDAAGRRTLTLADDCGAWIPQNPAKIMSQIAWPNR